MPTLQELLQDVLDRPADDQARLAYAAACDAAGDPRGKFIRVQFRLRDTTLRRDRDAEKEQDGLLARHGRAWAANVTPHTDRWEFDRGFVGLVRLPAERFLAIAPALYAKEPILHLHLTDAGKVFGALCASEHLRRIRSLDLRENGLTDDDMRVLAASPNLPELRWLSLAYNRIDWLGVELLAGSRLFPKLRFNQLDGNPSNPCEQISDDQGIITERRLPPEGERMEQRHGRVEWLHHEGAVTVLDLLPKPIPFCKR